MRTAVDTNVLGALWIREPRAAAAARTLGEAASQGSICISPIVYAESLAHPLYSNSQVEEFLQKTAITVDWNLQDSVWKEAGQRFARHAVRRRRSGGTQPRRLVGDFLIGAHALVHATELMTFDDGFFHANFPELRLLSIA